MITPPNMSPRDSELDRLNHFQEFTAAKVANPGVLLADEIERCCRLYRLIDPFSKEQLKAASYRLTVGSRYSLGGKRQVLKESDQITIPPFQVVVIQTAETLSLPRDMIARWNIKVKQAYRGLVWAGGPQVDPGYVGHLFCPIYNLSNEEVAVAYGEEIAVIDFVTTTAFSEGAKQYEFARPPKAVLLEDYDILQSGLSEAWDSFRQRIESIERRVTVFGGIGVTMIGVIMASLAVMVNANDKIKTLKFADWLCLFLAGLAVSISCWTWLGSHSRRESGVDVANSVMMVLIGIFLGVVAMFFALPLATR